MPQWGFLACCSSVRQVQLYHQRPAGVWCLMHVGHDVSSTSLGWSLLPSTVIIVLALVNSAVSPAGTSSISMRPRSAALLPVSTASTGILHLSVGAHLHRVRSDTEKYGMWPLPHAHHFQCVTHILGACVHIYTKYEVSTSNNVARRTVHSIVWALWLINQMSQKSRWPFQLNATLISLEKNIWPKYFHSR